MAAVTEREVYLALLEYAGLSEPIQVGNTYVTIELEPQDTHVQDSPDALLWVIVRLRVFEQDIHLRVPVPIEAEKTGMDDALKDLKKFIKREHYPLELPMLVVSARGYSTSLESGKLLVNFEVKQLPVGRIR